MTHRVLVVDDEADIREIVRLSLERLAGWSVLTAASGDEGLQLASREQPDAILLDVMMPGMDGPETARLLAEDSRTSGIPVLLLTARVRSSEREELAEGPVVAVLSKPFDPMTLAQDIAQALGWPS